MPQGGVLALFIDPGGGGFELLFARGWKIRPSKDFPGVLPGEGMVKLGID